MYVCLCGACVYVVCVCGVCVWCVVVCMCGVFVGTEMCIYILLFEQTIDVSYLYILLDSHNHAILIMHVVHAYNFLLFTQTCEKCSSECLTWPLLSTPVSTVCCLGEC